MDSLDDMGVSKYIYIYTHTHTHTHTHVCVFVCVCVREFMHASKRSIISFYGKTGHGPE